MSKKAFILILILLSFFIHRLLYGAEVSIVVSIYPLEDITKNIGKERVSVKTLIPPGASPHAFEPKPSDIKELTKASMFIKIGAGLELWSEGFVRSAKKSIRIVDLSETIELLKGQDHQSHHGHSNSHFRHQHEIDPHYWLDPVIAKSMVDRITAEFIRIDPSSKDFYITNATNYKKELDSLNERIKERLSRLKKKRFVAFHPAWNYFSKRYGLEPLYIVEATGRELRPKNIKYIVDWMKKENIKVVFGEVQFNPQIAEAIASEAGARLLMLDPIGSPYIPERNSYINLLLYNITQLEEALR
jgi:zinc transport system substrate-binding protein